MDILETIDASTYAFSNDKLRLELNTWLTANNNTKQDESLFIEDTKWLSDEPRKSKPKKSVLSTAVYTLDDGSSSSDDDEPPTPTNSTGFLPLHRQDSVESDYSVSTDDSSSSEQRDDCLEKEKSIVSTTMHPIQTQTQQQQQQQQLTPNVVDKKSWLRGLLKKKPKVVNLFNNKSKQTKTSIPEKKAKTKSIIKLLPQKEPTISPKKEPIIPQQPKKTHDDYTRYPLSTERAIYRLSHVKLANPRRPLHQQVVISNMMYWYLSILKKYHPHLLNNNNSNRHSTNQKTTPHYDADASFVVASKLKNNKYKPVINPAYKKR